MEQDSALLDVRGLTTTISTNSGSFNVVDGVSFKLRRSQTMGVVGESGSGKSMLCMSLIGLLPEPVARISQGQVLFQKEDLVAKSQKQLRKIRGAELAMILQDPLASLNPAYRIGDQIAETIAAHESGRSATKERLSSLLEKVGISDPTRRLRAFPHELSGGMRQRVVGAIAISCTPKLIIADEATTALDVTVQAQYLKLLSDLQRDTGAALIIVTHDLGVVAQMCEVVAVMYAGRIVEMAPVLEIFDRPAHPYTRALRDCLLKVNAPRQRLKTIEGFPPDHTRRQPGCAFAPRCPLASDQCGQTPVLREIKPDHVVACWKADEAAGYRSSSSPDQRHDQ